MQALSGQDGGVSVTSCMESTGVTPTDPVTTHSALACAPLHGAVWLPGSVTAAVTVARHPATHGHRRAGAPGHHPATRTYTTHIDTKVINVVDMHAIHSLHFFGVKL